jgi:hypothetical protein
MVSTDFYPCFILGARPSARKIVPTVTFKRGGIQPVDRPRSRSTAVGYAASDIVANYHRACMHQGAPHLHVTHNGYARVLVS